MMKKAKPASTTEKMTYPMRINRYVAMIGYATRRGADELIEAKKVTINGKIAVLGDKVQETDVVVVDENKKKNSSRVYLAYNKPMGIVTSAPQEGETSITDILHFRTKIFPVGRLDKNSRGLIILTNDGRITKRLLSPEYEHGKEYEVGVNKPIREGFLNGMRKGVQLEDFLTKPAEVEELDEMSFKITLTEGKKHQIRRMCTAFGYETRDLRRVKIMNVEIGNLREGQYRVLEGKELAVFLQSLGLKM